MSTQSSIVVVTMCVHYIPITVTKGITISLYKKQYHFTNATSPHYHSITTPQHLLHQHRITTPQHLPHPHTITSNIIDLSYPHTTQAAT